MNRGVEKTFDREINYLDYRPLQGTRPQTHTGRSCVRMLVELTGKASLRGYRNSHVSRTVLKLLAKMKGKKSFFLQVLKCQVYA